MSKDSDFKHIDNTVQPQVDTVKGLLEHRGNLIKKIFFQIYNSTRKFIHENIPPHVWSTICHVISSVTGGLFIGVCLHWLQRTWNSEVNHLAQITLDQFVKHYSEFPAAITNIAFLLVGISFMLLSPVGILVRRIITKPMFQAVSHACSLSAGMCFSLACFQFSWSGTYAGAIGIAVILVFLAMLFLFVGEISVIGWDHYLEKNKDDYVPIGPSPMKINFWNVVFFCVGLIFSWLAWSGLVETAHKVMLEEKAKEEMASKNKCEPSSKK